MAQSCVSLAGTTTCPAFDAASVSTTDPDLLKTYAFLASVTDSKSFDSQLRQYVFGGYAQFKYQDTLGCQRADLANSTELYARYTTSVLCNSIVQNSINSCGLSPAQSRPLCIDSCADFVLSEQRIVSSPELCGQVGPNANKLLRADFTVCQLPGGSITGPCIEGYQNEPNNCGFQNNLQGLCTYCRGSTVNSTDSCCVTSDVQARCQGVVLPTFSSTQPLSLPGITSSSTATAAPTAAAGLSSPSSSGEGSGLTGGQIAGIVVGAVLGAGLLLAMLILFCLLLRRRKARNENSSLNQPSPPHSGAGMTQTGHARFEALPGARVTRMTALEESSDPSSNEQTPETRRQGYKSSSSNDWATSPEARGIGAFGGTLPPKRGEKSSDESTPEKSSPDYSSPEAEPGQSEQMSSFKDYYSDDHIRPNDIVSTLWAYQPRANDEFELERGDMLRIVGIWDDGWATGVRVNQRAEDWEPGRSTLRDSGVSAASRQDDTPPTNGEIKAFPLVCVCLPQHWRKTIEGESSSSEAPPGPDP